MLACLVRHGLLLGAGIGLELLALVLARLGVHVAFLQETSLAELVEIAQDVGMNDATISGDKENFYNTIAQALTADDKPDPNGCGRVKLLDWIRKRRPDLLPVARLIMGTPSFIRLVKAEGALRLPSADGDDLDLSAADWDPLSLECPDHNDPTYVLRVASLLEGDAAEDESRGDRARVLQIPIPKTISYLNRSQASVYAYYYSN